MLIILGQQSNLMLDFSVFTLHIHKTNEKKKLIMADLVLLIYSSLVHK